MNRISFKKIVAATKGVDIKYTEEWNPPIIFFFVLHKSGQKHPNLEWSGFGMVVTIGLAEALPFEN